MKSIIDRIKYISPLHSLQPQIEEFNVPVSAFDLQWISPTEIKRNTGREWKPWDNKSLIVGDVRGGDWDITSSNTPHKDEFPKYYHDYFFHQSSVKHFKHGVDWKETELFRRMVKNRREREVMQELNEYDKLHEKIKLEGYKTQDELGNYESNQRKQYVNEICVDISRDGEYLFVDSRHRLSIAKILDLDSIPVAVIVWHEDWVNKIAESET